MLKSFTLQTRKRDEMIEITRPVTEWIRETGIRDGIAVVYCPHTTAGIAINENADDDVKHDVLMRLDEVFPWEHPKYRHAEGNSASHLKAVATGSSQTILLEGGRLLLGRWQGIYFCEYDGPRERRYLVKLLKE